MYWDVFEDVGDIIGYNIFIGMKLGMMYLLKIVNVKLKRFGLFLIFYVYFIIFL